MEHSPEIELILNGLYRDRDELSAKLNNVEKVIKRIKLGDLSFTVNKSSNPSNKGDNNTDVDLIDQFPHKADLKVQALKVIDLIGCACKLSEIQERHKEITGVHHNLRETVRNLRKHEIIKLLRPAGTERGLYWVKTDWLEDNKTKLMDRYKFDGFDLLYRDDLIEFV